jgi:hypothetical protein
MQTQRLRRASTKSASISPRWVDLEFRQPAEVVLRDGESLSRFMEQLLTM